MTSVIGLTFLAHGSVHIVITPNCSCCSLIKADRHERFSDKVQAGPGVPPLSSFPVASKTSESGWCFYISGSCFVCSLFFCFRGGRPLHNVLTFIFHSLGSPDSYFATFSFAVCLKALLSSPAS
jgi:hypothetical protein